MNINENVKNEKKIVTNIHKLTNFRPKPSLTYVIIPYVIQFDKLFYPVVPYENYLICIVMNINVNLKNDGKIIRKWPGSRTQGIIKPTSHPLIDAKLFIGTTAKQKILFSNINPNRICEIAWFPWQPKI